MKESYIFSIVMTIAIIIFSATEFSSNVFSQNQNKDASELHPNEWPNIHANVETNFNYPAISPTIEENAFIHPFGVVIGNCYVGKMVFFAPTAVCRGDEGTPIKISDYANVQDGVVLHGLETMQDGKFIDYRRYDASGERLLANNSKFTNGFSIFVGERTSLAHDSLVHGPAWIGNDTFIGMKSMVFNAKVGNNVSIGVSSTITGGVEVSDNKFVPPGSIITTQEQADALPERFGTSYENINKAVIHVNEQFAEHYDETGLEKLGNQREKQMEENMLDTGMLDGIIH